MVFDWDDYGLWGAGPSIVWPFTKMRELKTVRADFKCTLFAVPASKGPAGEGPDDAFWAAHPDWIELAVHGWTHPDPMECANWTIDDMRSVIDHRPSRFVKGFKAPGWQISDGCYDALLEAGWWVADQPYNDDRRPPGLRVHRLNVGPDHWHGHVQNVCGNGLEETWDQVVALVRAAPSFEFMSEAVQPWKGE
jgi:hypothetical protein